MLAITWMILAALAISAAGIVASGRVVRRFRIRRAHAARQARIRQASAVAEAQIESLTRNTIQRMRDAVRTDLRSGRGDGGPW